MQTTNYIDYLECQCGFLINKKAEQTDQELLRDFELHIKKFHFDNIKGFSIGETVTIN